MKKIILGAFIVLMAAWGCDKESARNDSDISTLRIDLSIAESDALTRAVSVAGDSLISDVNVFVYNTKGHLAAYRYQDSLFSDIELEVPVGQEFSVYAIANVGNLTGMPEVQTSDGITRMEWILTDVDSMFGTDGKIPMSGVIHSVKVGSNAGLKLDRLLAKFRIILDTTALGEEVERFDVKRIRLKQLNTRVSYFSVSKAVQADDILMDGMLYEEAEILPAFSEGLDFYLPENAQGDLLPDNLEEETHVPGPPFDQLCSYVEFLVSYRSDTRYNDSLIYRYYLHDGRQLDNFDVLRNTMYTCQTRFTGSGINETSWRIDVSGMKDYVTDIQISPQEHEFTQEGGTHQFSVSVLPLSAENKSVTWMTDDMDIATVSKDGVVTAVSDGTCNLIAVAADGSGVSGTAKITVNTYVYTESVTVFPDDAEIFIGDKLALRAEVQPSNSNDKSLSWVSTNPMVASVNAIGEVEALSGGISLIVVSTNDAAKKDTAVIKCIAKAFEMYFAHETLMPGYKSPAEISYRTLPETVPVFSLETIDGNAGGVSLVDGKVYAHNPEGVQGKVGTYRLTGEAHGIRQTKEFVVDAGLIKLIAPGTVYVGIPYNLKFGQISPADMEVTWSSSDESVMTVSDIGEVLALKAGSATIKVMSETGAWDEVEITSVNPVISVSDIETYEGFTTYLGDMTSLSPACDLEIGYEVIHKPECVNISSDGKLYAKKRNSFTERTLVKAYLTDYPAVSKTFRVYVKPAVQISLSGDNRIINTSGHPSDGRYLEGLQRSITLDMTLAPGESVYWEVRKGYSVSHDLTIGETGKISAHSKDANGEYKVFGWNRTHSFRTDTITLEVYQYLDYEVGISGVTTYSPSGGMTGVQYYNLSLHARWSEDSWTWMDTDQRLFIAFKLVGYPKNAASFHFVNTRTSASPSAFLEDWPTNIRVTGAGVRANISSFTPKSYIRGSFEDGSAGNVLGLDGQYYKLTATNTGVSGLNGYYFIRQMNDVFYNITDW